MTAIDNKMIILQKIAGYSLEPVVSLWYAKKNTQKCKESEFRRDSKNCSNPSFNMSRPNSASRIPKARR